MSKAYGCARKSKLVLLPLFFASDLETQIKDRAKALDLPVNHYLRGLARADVATCADHQTTNKLIDLCAQSGTKMVAPAVATSLGT